MLLHLLFILGGVSFAYCDSVPWNCSKSQAIDSFRQKTQTNIPQPLKTNPYENQSKSLKNAVAAYLNDSHTVCGLQYLHEDKSFYQLHTFDSTKEAIAGGFLVTHQGRCGLCSSTVDLAVYLSQNLTVPVRKCALKGILSHRWALKCLLEIGFTKPCASIWLYNSLNTRKDCFGVCIKSWLKNEPFNHPDGSLNSCLQCDEDLSGPIFKYFSGRTRRNSGIPSAIDRPSDQVYPITHCYY